MKIRSVEAELFRADGETDGRNDGRTNAQTNMTKFIAAFRNFANRSKTLDGRVSL